MTIRLFDVQAQRQHREEVETFEKRARERAERGEWGVDLGAYPKAPEPIVDSRDRNASGGRPFAGPVGYGGTLIDGGLTAADALDKDGTSSEAPKGWETGWQDNKAEQPHGHMHRTDAPFKTKE